MRLSSISIMLLAAAASLASAATTSQKSRFLMPVWLQPASASGRSDDVGSGRGLLAKFMMFRNMFQQPQSNVIIITQPTTSTTTTDAETRSAKKDADEDSLGDAVPTGSSTALSPTGDDELLPVIMGSNGVNNKINLDGAEHQQQQSPHRRNSGQRKQLAGQFSKPAKRHRVPVNSGDLDAGGSKAAKRKANKGKRRRKIIRVQNKNDKNGNRHAIDASDSMNSGASGDGSAELSTNSRIQNIMNAFRRQTPVEYNH